MTRSIIFGPIQGVSICFAFSSRRFFSLQQTVFTKSEHIYYYSLLQQDDRTTHQSLLPSAFAGSLHNQIAMGLNDYISMHR